MEQVTVASLVVEAIRDIINEYGMVNLIIGFLACAILLLGKYLYDRKGMRWYTLLLTFLSIVYISFVIELTLITREHGSRIGSNLKLWGTYGEDPLSQSYMVENLLMLIPLGILMGLLFRKMKRIWICLVVSTVATLAVEITQHVTQRGYFQVDDIWLNVLGALIGYVIIMPVVSLIKKAARDNQR